MTNSFFINRLSQEPHALLFSGQSTPWPTALADLCAEEPMKETLGEHDASANRLISDVATELLATNGRQLDLFSYQANPAKLGAAADASASVPGIALTQLGAIIDMDQLGYDLGSSKPSALLGHSQGVLGVHMAQAVLDAGSLSAATKQIDEILAIAKLIGSAGTRQVRRLGIHQQGEATPMLSVKGATRKQVEILIDRVSSPKGPISIAVTNSQRHLVLSGYPEDLASFAIEVGKEASHQAKLRESKVRGGTPFNPTLEYLDVTLPFHSPLMADAVEECVAWAARCGLDVRRSRSLAQEVLLCHVDWAAQVHDLLDRTDPSKLWLVDLGPGETIGKLVTNLTQGTGVGVVEASTRAQRSDLATMQGDPERSQDWSSFKPTLLSTPAGDRISTAFSRLTGKPPVLLAGMTPTTVDPQIVAAAANAGYWAELAGGGQVSAEVFERHMKELEGELEEGRTVEFNAMFMDRYLWNLQFGSQRIVSKKRESGAPIDGVVVSAGIPELDEAQELIDQLNSDGFSYVAFKPGTVEQIRQVVAIAKKVAPKSILMQVEGGAAGGHHSWESLDDLLSTTYAQVRECPNIVLVAGGGIGTPERAADYISGQWSRAYGLPDMPVDGILVGTAAMTAKEAHTSPDVKQALVATPGIDMTQPDPDPFAPIGERWVPSGQAVGGMSSGLSHLHADIYEIENSSAECGRLLVRVMKHPDELESRRKDIITALDKTAKPYFGDVEEMTYQQWAQRFAQLACPWVDDTYVDRFLHLLRRIEARVCDLESGEFKSIFLDREDVRDADRALGRLHEAYPQADEMKVVPTDVAWFPTLVREYPKPMPFVPVIDNDLLRWWGQDQLWQSEDDRYSADSVRAIPGPISVAGITTIDEPVASILSRFEQAAVTRVRQESGEPQQAYSQLSCAASAEEFIRRSPHISWVGHLMDNPAFGTPVADRDYEIRPAGSEQGLDLYDLDIHLDTFWDDDLDGGISKHAVRHIVIPLTVDAGTPGASPVVDRNRLPEDVYDLLAATAGIGNTSITGDRLDAMPAIEYPDDAEGHPFGVAHTEYTLSGNLGFDHEAATGAALPSGLRPSAIAPDALVGPAWPAIYAALGSVSVDGFPIIEGLLNAVHLDHLIELEVDQEELLSHVGQRVLLTSWAEDYSESASGRVVTIHVRHAAEDGTVLANEVERFAIRGRAYSDQLPQPAPDYGGIEADIVDTPRRLLRKVSVTAPADMTAFARTSGDFNPIHTSVRGAKVSGLKAPLVHGMWLSATAQYALQATDEQGMHYEIAGWTYNMYGMVQLGDRVEISIERVGKVRHGGLVLEVICRIGGELVSRGTAIARIPRVAYVYPGQGIQQQGMVLDERAKSAAARETWERADALTRSKLGFSILAVVRDNPKSLTAKGVTYYHPEGLLNLTQFTQVALATVAFAQTARLRESGSDIWPAYFAGHSLGEYNALSSFAGVMSLETVLELVFHRGSTMHSLIERDEQGRSNYRMGALRPNQFGLGDDGVKEYVQSVSQECGEFLEIVNYNLAGQQYAIAGTIAGLEYLRADSNRRAKEAGGKPAFMYVPGIDVPFHSSLLRKGVPEFRDTLDKLLPQYIDYSRLEGRYIPNLVARPFEMTRDFAASILEVVPSERIRQALDDPAVWDSYASDDQKLGRLLLTELLSWQFASPVRWIETQSLMFSSKEQGGLGLEELVEVGLGHSPTLANMAAKTLKLPDFRERQVVVYNLGRDESRVYLTDTDPNAAIDDGEEDEAGAVETSASSSTAQSLAGSEPVAEAPATQAAPAQGQVGAGKTASAASVASEAPGSVSGADVADIPFRASDAIAMLLAYSAKIRPDQIGTTDTTDSLTNGVSSRRNQLLMDISSELGVASVDGAAEASMTDLSALVNKVAPNYKPFGPVLSEIVRDRVKALFGPAGIKLKQVEDRVSDVWKLGPGWVAAVVCSLVLNTREGASSRGGELAKLPTQAVSTTGAANALIDQGVQDVAQVRGIAVALPNSGSGTSGSVVDSAALDAFASRVTGSQGLLASTARFVLDQLGLHEPLPANGEDEDAAVVSAVEAELGSDWPKQVEAQFDERKAVLFDDRWASAREDLARIYYEDDADAHSASFVGAGVDVQSQAAWYERLAGANGKPELAQVFARIATEAGKQVSLDPHACEFVGDIAVVTGVSRYSIAGSLVAGLLAGGATVVAVMHDLDQQSVQWAKKLYRQHAVAGAKLWIVPANLSSFRDVDALVSWVGSTQKKTTGATTTILKPAMEPTILLPFAAPPMHGTMADSGRLFESQARLMLWSVERMIAGFSRIGEDTDVDHKLHVVLPGSPNRGMFGGDGAYGEVKAAMDAIVNRAGSEHDWSDRVTFAHPLIGWVRGTGLMGANDSLVKAVERHGVRTYSTQEMADRLLGLCTMQSRRQALDAPLKVDLTGGLGHEALDLRELKSEAEADNEGSVRNEGHEPVAVAGTDVKRMLKALPTPRVPRQPKIDLSQWDGVTAKPEEQIVIVSIGEMGPWGSGRTRFEAEMGIHSDGTVDLSAAAVLELAWNMGLIEWQDSPTPGWYDADGNLVAEEDIAERYHDEVVARSGIRPFDEGMGSDYRDGTDEEEVDVFLDHDVEFSVPTQEMAEEYVKLDPDHTQVSEDRESGEWNVTRTSGSKIRVPRRATMSRTVGGQFPKGFDPVKWGIPASMVSDVDEIALWNIVTTVDAYLSAGFTPVEILQAVHPSKVASTQGTGFGGMSSMRKLYLDRYLGREIPTDILQEALPNVVAAHVMQSYIGGYGNMVQPVSACATAAVSLEEGVDKIALGKADFVVTGAIDDIGVESVIGFGNMNATANSSEMYSKGIAPRFFSRANDRRRGGFLESQGGGTILLTRGDIALKMGLPVAGVVGYIHSFADGAHTSIPAPGLGALAAGMGGKDSDLVRSLAKLGVTPDDIAVVSKHDTSTNANDPNESELHNTLAHAIGRSEGNPLYVISQKSLTGHAKGGACIFQINGLTQLFASGVIPANAALDCVDPELERDDHMVWLEKPLHVGSIKAGLVTSLGFGHVSGIGAIVSPGAFEASVAKNEGDEALQQWRAQANARLAEGQRRLQEGRMGRAALYEPIDNRRFHEDAPGYNAHELEKSMLLDPEARLGVDGYFEA
ncbi:type I polyketide synthase [Bifidobacterium bombi]|uniref:Fatty acid synthase Fas n=1 Tax=Bifidobacterium bombi DSM 19703 TaxID=1341695 RepID=A0A080N4A6_9BIFI|nr:type I polyketide synthase [Bifidobacterium bombi]KFF31185.1 fatty acid synthase Fas [Bifidobacterium bombi DSM 19703]